MVQADGEGEEGMNLILKFYDVFEQVMYYIHPSNRRVEEIWTNMNKQTVQEYTLTWPMTKL